jgi:sugar/nucleoside kinase (ribokinase family)
MDRVNIIGGALVDLNFSLPKQFIHRYQQAAKIELPFGEKLLTDGYQLTPGGSGANVAIGLTRAGYRAWFHTGVASDVFGSFLSSHLKKEGVELDEGDGGSQTPLSIILRVGGERTIVTGRSTPTSFPVQFPDTGWLHLGPLHGELDTQLNRLISHQVKTSQELSLNPSQDMIIARSRPFLTLIRSATILFLNRFEALSLTRLPHRSSPKELLVALYRLGPKVVCLTDGENGAYVTGGAVSWFAPALTGRYERIDATGAGDAFTTGFLASFLGERDQGKSYDDCLETALGCAVANSGAAVSEVGGQAGLLTLPEMQNDARRVRIKEID